MHLITRGKSNESWHHKNANNVIRLDESPTCWHAHNTINSTHATEETSSIEFAWKRQCHPNDPPIQWFGLNHNHDASKGTTVTLKTTQAKPHLFNVVLAGRRKCLYGRKLQTTYTKNVIMRDSRRPKSDLEQRTLRQEGAHWHHKHFSEVHNTQWRRPHLFLRPPSRYT